MEMTSTDGIKRQPPIHLRCFLRAALFRLVRIHLQHCQSLYIDPLLPYQKRIINDGFAIQQWSTLRLVNSL